MKDEVDFQRLPIEPLGHQHQYTIPVEWKQLWEVPGVTYEKESYRLAGKRVIRVMCECGEVKEI